MKSKVVKDEINFSGK